MLRTMDGLYIYAYLTIATLCGCRGRTVVCSPEPAIPRTVIFEKMVDDSREIRISEAEVRTRSVTSENDPGLTGRYFNHEYCVEITLVSHLGGPSPSCSFRRRESDFGGDFSMRPFYILDAKLHPEFITIVCVEGRFVQSYRVRLAADGPKEGTSPRPVLVAYNPIDLDGNLVNSGTISGGRSGIPLQLQLMAGNTPQRVYSFAWDGSDWTPSADNPSMLHIVKPDLFPPDTR
jgi:hypothetical protein